ncbi:uncharacterized protein [Mytilus edulis]|uniref:uncharacterized protein n=2 Tax=Mytilus edulis TaxID=6550 RepID=UPI0039EFB0D0
MGNLGTKKKQKEEDIADDVWLKLNDGQQKSPKSKKKKKKKRKKKGKGDSPDRVEEDVSQCDSYSYSTLSSRKLSDSTIASAGTITQQNERDGHNTSKLCGTNVDDQSNGSIGYVTASDTFTPPVPRKGIHAKFSPVIARDSPRVVRRLLQREKILESPEKILETPNESLCHLSPRAKFFLTTPEPPKNMAFENRKFSRHSSGSSIDSRTFTMQSDNKTPQMCSEGGSDDKSSKICKEREKDNRCITNGSLIVKSRQLQQNKNTCDSRFSNNSLEMSDSTTENLVRTGEKAKLIRYDGGNLSPAERRKCKQTQQVEVDKTTKIILPFVKFDSVHPQQGVHSNFIDYIERPERDKKTKRETYCVPQNEKLKEENDNAHLKVESCAEFVPPPSPASGVTLLEVDECAINESETCSDIHLSKDDEIFGDSICKRLSLLLESEQDNAKLNRSEFHEFTDSPSSSPDIPEVQQIDPDDRFEEDVFRYLEQSCLKSTDFDDTYKSIEETEIKSNLKQEDKNLKLICKENYEILTVPKVDATVKTPQGRDNASVLDVMNNNFRMKSTDEDTNSSVKDRTEVTQRDVCKKVSKRKSELDIEEQMKHENELNEKLIQQQIEVLQNILPTQNETNKRNSTLFAVNNKHANDPDNYILVTKKTYGVKSGILVELMDEEKDLLTRDVIKTMDGNDWIATGSEQKYKPESMIIETGLNVKCPVLTHDHISKEESELSCSSESLESLTEPVYDDLDDYQRHNQHLKYKEGVFDIQNDENVRHNREFDIDDYEFEKHEREFEKDEHNFLKHKRKLEIHDHEYSDIPSSDEEIDFKNILNRSQSQSESDCSDFRPKRESDNICEVIKSYKDEDYSDYSDEISEEEILYSEEPRTERQITVKRTPSKLDQSIQKLFLEKSKQLSISVPQRPDKPLESFDLTPTAEVYEQSQAGGYDSPFHKSSEGSRRSVAYTESDLDASEKWEDDDDDASNDSMLADDEDDDDEFGQIIFSKPYIEYDDKVDASFSYSKVQTMPESPVVWEPEPEEDDVFQDNMPVAASGYHPEDSLESSDEAFGDARKQMQEIHEQLQTLREQMVTFDKEEDDSSLPTSPFDDRILNIPKGDKD